VPRAYPCPGCDRQIITYLRPGESVACPECDRTSEVPPEAVETEVALPPRVPRIPDGTGAQSWRDVDWRMSRRGKVVAAIVVGIILYVEALYSTGAGHGSYIGVILFYPMQFVLAGWCKGLSDGMAILLCTVLSLPWYPVLVFLLTSKERAARVWAILLLVLQVIATVGLMLFL